MSNISKISPSLFQDTLPGLRECLKDLLKKRKFSEEEKNAARLMIQEMSDFLLFQEIIVGDTFYEGDNEFPIVNVIVETGMVDHILNEKTMK